jgi:phosphoenolpyruvate carboxylase
MRNMKSPACWPQRDLPMTAKERADNTERMHARVTMLWQTRLLRYTKLSVEGRINNALSYYRMTFSARTARLV